MKRDPEIMQHADGELTGDARTKVDELLASDDEARGKHEALAELGDLVRGHLELTSDAVPQARFDAMWRAIERSGFAGPRSDAEGRRAESIDRAIDSSATAASNPGADGNAGWLRRISRWLDQRRGYFVTAVVSAGAVAALALVWRAPSPGIDGTGAVGAASAVGAFRPTVIDSLETPGGTGNVFQLHDEDGSTTVIWVTQEDSVGP
jgi:anti-sigma factor RsiW